MQTPLLITLLDRSNSKANPHHANPLGFQCATPTEPAYQRLQNTER